MLWLKMLVERATGKGEDEEMTPRKDTRSGSRSTADVYGVETLEKDNGDDGVSEAAMRFDSGDSECYRLCRPAIVE